VRWTFTSNPDHRAEIESHLLDLGADVVVREGSDFLVTWEEPDEDLLEVVETIWSLNGQPFEVIQEEFHRLSLNTLHYCEDETGQEAA
jgi:hypothetical protein